MICTGSHYKPEENKTKKCKFHCRTELVFLYSLLFVSSKPVVIG